jgi:hypothetical protein
MTRSRVTCAAVATLVATLVAGMVAACAPTPGAPAPASQRPAPAPPTGRAADSAHIAAIELEARALAKTTGCSRDDQCRNAPVGINACGGVRYYLNYCAASTDSVALFARLAQLDSAERAFNARYHVVSTCMMITPTRPHLEGGVCK